MSQDNQITLRGYLTAEPRFRQTAQTGTPVTEIRVGSTPRRLNRDTGEWQDAQTSYYRITCWRRLAVNAASSLHKGDMVVVRGRFYTRSWLDNQQRQRTVLEIEADSLGHDLAYGWSHFLRGIHPSGADRAAVSAGEAVRQGLGLVDDEEPEEDAPLPTDLPADGDGDGYSDSGGDLEDSSISDRDGGLPGPDGVTTEATGSASDFSLAATASAPF
jgi:single-strand DNA-binding protein